MIKDREKMDLLKVIQEYMNCYKENCKDELEKINNDNKLKVLKKRLEKRKDWKDIDKIILEIYSNKNQKDFDLCEFKNCKIRKDDIYSSDHFIQISMHVYRIKPSIRKYFFYRCSNNCIIMN